VAWLVSAGVGLLAPYTYILVYGELGRISTTSGGAETAFRGSRGCALTHPAPVMPASNPAAVAAVMVRILMAFLLV